VRTKNLCEPTPPELILSVARAPDVWPVLARRHPPRVQLLLHPAWSGHVRAGASPLARGTSRSAFAAARCLRAVRPFLANTDDAPAHPRAHAPHLPSTHIRTHAPPRTACPQPALLHSLHSSGRGIQGGQVAVQVHARGDVGRQRGSTAADLRLLRPGQLRTGRRLGLWDRAGEEQGNA